MDLEKLEWDSAFFGVPVFRTDIKSITDVKGLEDTGTNRLVYVFADRVDEDLYSKLQGIGAQHFDTRFFYRKNLNEESLPGSSDVKLYEGELNDDLEALVWQAGEFSRFHKDKKLQPYFKSFYTRWMINSLNKRIADKVFVQYDKGRISGLATCKLKGVEGWLGLIAVKEGGQRKGRGSSLLNTVENFYIENGVYDSWVITQQDNVKACKFYEGLGYELARQEMVFHLWQ